ncbi:MAG: hypothetical protein A3J30_02480 [Candidatus Wildermuthbacteria bacterium RIFCSPLOWO2_02_FULL_47_9c]|uniref:DNA polymerase III subunit delta n=2 Tax=Parcubacteria group TaxID=1794811 RepID=A0A1G2RUN8_9BACT|nr:MAG: hypothetical protein A2674_02300 [Candidatus Wildermuthbacteria bacterium RIFCSPHIGHO2_01_FULL_50_47]OHA69860.1 MAG: hypothetical protein A3D63_01315 [Candidatus Wildermuthbacteria bacterium RIFCSPHIGHO2_02_FULL_49_17]OHA71726.1 MAG: hypothetical protein A3E08_01920 [Candidatus Wildermuthbacteria bacterium RIFCSPHIGHO2_12_FULL_49_13]OHA75771.1 MAG: hypothetical protein A3J30_02480 [Candidatus Wildermuthbacteria bacterium RIFCSPLOWO2_02_FULL_47_9c]OHA77501.1 MAG: hypothetical protein A25
MMRHAEFLKKAAAKKTLAHAYLFSGNDRAQKEELVRDLLEILGVSSADSVVINPSEETSSFEITISQIRRLAAFLSMTSWNSSHKAVQIQDAHRMNQEAQSAFLKLLEEPRGDTILFLLTEHPDMLFETIRSRAQEFKFYSFSQMQIPGDVTREFQKLQRADLHMRFSYAKNLSDEPECIDDVLRQWISVLRKALHEAARKDSERALPLSRSVRTMQEIQFLLRTTNVNPRLALERALLSL